MTAERVQVVLEEFGKWIKAGTGANLAERDDFYTAIYQEVSNVCTIVLSHALLPDILNGICGNSLQQLYGIQVRAERSGIR